MRRSTLLIALVLVALLSVPPAAALADTLWPSSMVNTLRLDSLGKLDWLITDDQDLFLNPANSAFAAEEHASLVGSGTSNDYDAFTGDSRALGGEFIAPLSGGHVLGGTINRGNDDYKYPDPGTSSSGTTNLYLQDGYRVNERLGLGLSLTSAYLSGDSEFGQSEIRSNTHTWGLGTGVTYKADPKVTLEGRLGYLHSQNEYTAYENGSVSMSGRGVAEATEVTGKLGVAPTDRLYLAAIAGYQYNRPNDHNSRFSLGTSYAATDRLLLVGGWEKLYYSVPSLEPTRLAGGLEYRVNDRLSLRGGVSRIDLDSARTALDVSLGAECAFGSGKLETLLQKSTDDGPPSGTTWRWSVGYTAQI